MVSQGGQTRPQVGDVAASGVTLDSATITTGTVTTLGATTINATTINASGLLWNGAILTSGHGSTSGSAMGGIIVSGRVLHSENGFIRMNLSGQSIWLAYWVSS